MDRRWGAGHIIYGIDVVLVEPGAVHTPIWDKLPDLSLYEGTDYAGVLERGFASTRENHRNRWALPPDRVSHVVLRALTARRPRARYLVLYRRLREWSLPRWLPTRCFDWLIARELSH